MKLIKIGSNLAKIGSNLVSKEWAPNDISNLKLWLEPSAISKDIDNYVDTWFDRSGNEFDAEQSVQASKPLWVDDALNGKPVLRFDGNNDFIDSHFDETVEQPFVLFAVWKVSQTGRRVLIDNFFSTILDFHDNDVRITASATAAVGYSKSAPFPNYILTTGLYNLASSKLFENGLNKGSGDVGDRTLPGLRIGKWTAGSRWFAGDLAEIICYDKLLTETERQTVENYLMTKYDL